MKPIAQTSRIVNCLKKAYVVLVLSAATVIAAPAQTLTTLHSFCAILPGCLDGYDPVGGLVQGIDGNLYGTTISGGANGFGTVFKISPGGTLTTLYSFCSILPGCTDGMCPYASLVQATDGNLYGTTFAGGANAYGTIFKITPSGTLTTLYTFCSLLPGCTDGGFPNGALIQGSDGKLYGTAQSGGANGQGTVFKITLSGTLTTIYNFCSVLPGCTDGEAPLGGLVQAPNGNFFGTTNNGGANGVGTVFELTPGGTLSTLHSFCSVVPGCTDGEYPDASLAQANGSLYGTTVNGGANGQGTVFKITPSGTLTTLYSFCSVLPGCTDGEEPYGALILATDGNFYGTTFLGGSGGQGTAYKITPSGTLTTLYSFCSVLPGRTDGEGPIPGLIQHTSGQFYGVTDGGGANGNNGTVFSLTSGLGPFVETLPASGKVGAGVRILGSNLKGATSVTFNGTPATFTVVRASEITTTVPAGATSGKVQVVTPSGTLLSNTGFRVRP